MKKIIILLLMSVCFSCSVKKKNTGVRIYIDAIKCCHCGEYFLIPSKHKGFIYCPLEPKKDWMFDPFEENTSNRKMFNVLKKSDTLIKNN